MRFRSIMPFRKLSGPAMAGLGLVGLVSMLGTSGCTTYKLTQIYVEPSAGACVSQGGTAQYTAYGVYTQSGHATKTEDITDSVTWSSDLSEVGSVSSTGLVTASTTWTGNTDIKASAMGEFGIVWGSANFTVPCSTTSSAIVPSGLKILPGDQKLEWIGDTTKLVAIGQYSGAPWSRDLSQHVTWTSSDPKVATVTAEGLVTAAKAGEATITATNTDERGAVLVTTIKVDVGQASAAE
ncbi:MAG TPA: Ig-like domain-containing protein [Acidobacteriaceae bacterium]|nr:Ig-like domain-containing protein [Acidobacteriaceae bacterium]